MNDAVDPSANVDVDEPARPVGVADVVCGTALVLGVIASYVSIVVTPRLLAHHALLLEAVFGGGVAIVTGGAYARVGRVSLVLVVLAPLCAVLLYDVFFWWAGRLWGDRVTSLYTERRPWAARWLDRTETWVRRRGVVTLALAYYLPVPNILIYALCGISGMSLGAFLLGDVIGTLLWEALLVSLGWAIGHPAVHVVHEISRYSLRVTIAVVVVAVAVSVLRQRRAARRRVNS